MKRSITSSFITMLLVVLVAGVAFSQHDKSSKKNGKTKYTSSQQSLSKVKPCLPASPACNLLVPKDGTFTELTTDEFLNSDGDPNNDDDGATVAIPLGFSFSFFGTTYTNMYVGLNGYVTFDSTNSEYSSVAFPYAGAGYAMVAAFFADVQLTPGSHIWFKTEPHRAIVIWENVGYYHNKNDKTNTFEMIITDQTNNEAVGALAGRNNLAFSYGLMQWTTGDPVEGGTDSYVGGTDGIGGTSATVGVNKGDGVGYFQIGRFNQDNDYFSGRQDTTNGIGWLSFQGTSCTPNLSYFQYDIHANTFVSLNSPLGGETYRTNSTHNVTWHDVGSPSLNLDLSTDGGSTWSNIASGLSSVAGDGTYAWNVPNNANTNQARLKLYDKSNNSVYSETDNFTIYKSYQLVFPNGSEMISAGSNQVITWRVIEQDASPRHSDNDKLQLSKADGNNSANRANDDVDLYYSIDGGTSWTLIASDVKSYPNMVNSYNWSVPTVASNLCKIKIKRSQVFRNRTESSSGYYNVSDNYFTIYQPLTNGQITLTTPNGGEAYTGGSYNYISWRRSGIVPGSQSLEFSSDGGATWSKITNAPIAGVMRYSWLAPKINSDKCLVKICNGVTGKEYDRSNSYFSVATPTLLKNYPNPFNPTTKISFSLERNAFTTLRVYNTIGQQIAELVNKELKAGVYEYEFNAQNLPSGVYLYNLTVDGKSQINKMMLLK